MKTIKTMKTITKLTFFSILVFSLFTEVKAQLKVGSNPTTLNSSAALEVESTNKGFLPPRVALTGTKDATTIPSPAAGLLVINTATAGSGTTAVIANTLYIWDGTQWNRIVTNNGNTSATNSNPFVVGETRTCLIQCNNATIDSPGPAIIMMVGKGSNQTTSVTRRAASQNAINSPSYIIFRGLRMDFIKGSDITTQSAKLYNTTSNPITYNLAALSTNDANIDAAGSTVAAGAYSYKIDGDDLLAATYNTRSEYVNVMVTFPDGEWYLCTWHAVKEANITNLYMTAQRLN